MNQETSFSKALNVLIRAVVEQVIEPPNKSATQMSIKYAVLDRLEDVKATHYKLSPKHDSGLRQELMKSESQKAEAVTPVIKDELHSLIPLLTQMSHSLSVSTREHRIKHWLKNYEYMHSLVRHIILV